MIGDKIKLLRTKKNLTQEQLADEIGVRQSTIGMIERNKRGVSNELLIKLADYFNVTLDYLLTDKEKLEIAASTLNKLAEISKNALKDSNINIKNNLYDIAFKFNNEEFSKEEQEQIIDYINYIISKRR